MLSYLHQKMFWIHFLKRVTNNANSLFRSPFFKDLLYYIGASLVQCDKMLHELFARCFNESSMQSFF